MANRPGVMLYFDMRPALSRLKDEQLGWLFMAILDYAEYGEMPDLDPVTGMCFDMLRPKIDRDGERYDATIEQRKYAVYCREARKNDCEPLSFDDWKQDHSVSVDNG